MKSLLSIAKALIATLTALAVFASQVVPFLPDGAVKAGVGVGLTALTGFLVWWTRNVPTIDKVSGEVDGMFHKEAPVVPSEPVVIDPNWAPDEELAAV